MRQVMTVITIRPATRYDDSIMREHNESPLDPGAGWRCAAR